VWMGWGDSDVESKGTETQNYLCMNLMSSLSLSLFIVISYNKNPINDQVATSYLIKKSHRVSVAGAISTARH
jgi:hypothetical protein